MAQKPLTTAPCFSSAPFPTNRQLPTVSSRKQMISREPPKSGLLLFSGRPHKPTPSTGIQEKLTVMVSNPKAGSHHRIRVTVHTPALTDRHNGSRITAARNVHFNRSKPEVGISRASRLLLISSLRIFAGV